MTRRAWTFAGIPLLVVLLAFALRNTVTAAIIVPLAYIWWVIRLYYAAIPQAIFWMLLAVIVFFSAVSNLLPKVERRAASKVKLIPARGHIETLADTIKKSEHGTYYKWLVANRLGKDAREILAQREGNPAGNPFGRLQGRGWNPPSEIDSYLEVGLVGSFANFPRPRWPLRWQKQKLTPLDVKAQQVIDYLEDEMEIENGRH